MDLKPTKEKFNIAVFFMAAIYICSGANDVLTQRSNVAVEKYIFTLGGDIENHGKELDRLYTYIHRFMRILFACPKTSKVIYVIFALDIPR